MSTEHIAGARLHWVSPQRCDVLLEDGSTCSCHHPCPVHDAPVVIVAPTVPEGTVPVTMTFATHEEQHDMPAFVKNDAGKMQYAAWLDIADGFQRNAVPARPLEEVVRVLDNGAAKYSPGNWAKCQDPERYFDAALRHIQAFRKGEVLDPDDGEHHLAHAMCCLLFLREL